ncbi:hypothetical protein [Streptomyces sp. YU58]|uniref:hypothetical protein n=1 Tax=Streptomyces sp. SX92 TaxID=3158972 RepID=UPI0027BB0D31|nr:hypothetical protein [Streptomyces coralus]WLW54892.1 hypothetical protein QU709_27690 [Streptomyces coralus]
MRGLPARRIASSALCATLLAGIAGPAAVAAERDPSTASVQAAQAPVPNADALLAQVKGLGNLGTVLTPVTDLLNAVLKADNGQLSAEEATKLGDAVKEALAKVTAAAPAAPATPPVAPPATSTLPTLPTVPTLPSTKSGDAKAPAAQLPADLVGDAVAALQKAVDALLKAAQSGDVTQVVAALTGVLTGLVNLVAATLLGGGLPAPNLPGLPALPTLPSLPTGPLPTS